VLDSVATALEHLRRQGWRTRFVPLWPADVESGIALRDRLGGDLEITERFLSLPDLLAAMRGCRVFVGQKLHSVILASAVHVPTVMLEYHPKCRDFQRSVERERWTLRTDSVAADAVVEMVEAIDGDYEQQRSQVFDVVRELRRRLEESATRARTALPPELR
jgi:polysaccharide pyruvyl transferase WcaK-like protein